MTGKRCPLCGSKAIGPEFYACALTDHPCDLDAIQRAERAAEKAEQNRLAFLKSLPRKYWRYLDEPLNLPEAAKQKMASMTPRGFIYLFGDASAGKTHAAVCKASSWLSEGFTVKFIDETEYFSELLRSFGGGEAPDLLSPDILIWDDFGKRSVGKEDGFVMSEVFRVVNYRFAHEKGTIFTSNLPAIEAVSRLSKDAVVVDSLVSRLTAGQGIKFTAEENHRKGSAI